MKSLSAKLSAALLAIVVLMGAAFFAAGRFGLPSWARTRQRQMEDIIERLRSSVAVSPGPEPDALPAGDSGEGA